MTILATNADPLYAQRRAERPAYATGMLLDAQDFSDEQTYHRGRLALAMAYVAGGGTLAGLLVEYVPQSPTQAEEIRVQPGLAVDRLGRLVELQRPACRGLADWFADTAAADGGDTLRTSAYDNLQRFLSPRLAELNPTLPPRAVIADVYLRFAQCAVGLTPSFAAGPFDALNAVSTSRIRDAYELQMIPRTGLSNTQRGLPLPPADALIATGTPAQRRNASQDAVLSAYVTSGHIGGTAEGPPPGPEHPPNLDTSAVFIARVLIPVGATNPPQRFGAAAVVDNYARRFLPSVPLLAQSAGI